jgi:hypothetical protein
MGCGSSHATVPNKLDTHFYAGNSVHSTHRLDNSNRDHDRFAEKLKSYLSQTYTRDKRCPLNEWQLYGITKTWRAIRVNFSEVALNMFIR